MKVRYQTANARLTFEFESENDKTLVTNLAHIQEIFEECACGCCESKRIRFDVREFDGNHYYKLLCDDCGATLDFGQHKTGNTLFVKRFEKDTRDPLPHRGWYQYGKSPEKTPSTPPACPAKSPATPPSGKSSPTPSPSKSVPAASASPAAPTQDRSGQVAANVAKAIDAMDHARDVGNLDSWKNWIMTIPDLTAGQREKLQGAYSRNTNRIACSGSTRRTA